MLGPMLVPELKKAGCCRKSQLFDAFTQNYFGLHTLFSINLKDLAGSKSALVIRSSFHRSCGTAFHVGQSFTSYMVKKKGWEQ